MIIQNSKIRKKTIIQFFLLVLLFIIGIFYTDVSQADLSVPELTSNTEIATAGFYHLSWKSDAKKIELQESNDSNFTSAITLYKGADTATLISGKPDGTWYYRIRNINNGNTGNWSQPVVVTVSHHSLSRALTFFVIGFLMFIATVTLVIKGIRNTE